MQTVCTQSRLYKWLWSTRIESISDADAGRGLPPTDRTLCRAVKEATWYTDVITAQPDFSQRLALRPELEVRRVTNRRHVTGTDSYCLSGSGSQGSFI